MSDIKIDLTNDTNGLNVAVEWLTKPFDEMVKNVGPINKKALDTAAYIIKDKVKETFVNKMPAAGRPFKVPATSKGGYPITKPDRLVDAVRQSSATTYATHVFVGNGSPGSPLFISRMYNKGSKERYQRTYRKEKLKRRRHLGHIEGLDYWGRGVSSGESEAVKAIERIFENYTKRWIDR